MKIMMRLNKWQRVTLVCVLMSMPVSAFSAAAMHTAWRTANGVGGWDKVPDSHVSARVAYERYRDYTFLMGAPRYFFPSSNGRGFLGGILYLIDY